MILKDIHDLIQYGKQNGLIHEEDETLITNRLFSHPVCIIMSTVSFLMMRIFL